MKRWLLLYGLLLLGGCGYNEFDPMEGETELLKPNITIAELRHFYETGGVTTFARDYLIGGVVTASDRSGNFYRSFILEDYTGAVEVKAGTYDLHTLFPLGRVVYIRLQGVSYGNEHGMYQLGLKGRASSGYEIDFWGHQELIDRYVVRSGMNFEFQPADIGIEQLNDEMIGRLVTLYGVTLEGGGETTWAVPAQDSWSGLPEEKEILATDMKGASVRIYTSGYADFAGETVPAGMVSLSGIVMKKGNQYRIKMRELEDVVVY